MRCHEMGITKMLMTVIPYFGKIVVMAFECECGFRNSEIVPGKHFLSDTSWLPG